MGNGYIKGSLNLSAGIYSKSDVTCPICGKVFRPAVENVFWVKINGQKTDLCSHNCFGKALEKGYKKRKPRGR